MTRSQRLHRIASQVEREQSATSKRLAELRSALGREEAQLEALRGHLASYRSSMADVQLDGALAVQLKNYARFTERLHLAVKEQEQRVEMAYQAYERQLAVWKEQRARVKAVESVADKHAAREQRSAERAEQRFIDDLVIQRFMSSES